MAPKKKAKNGQNDAVIAAQKKQVDQLRKLVRRTIIDTLKGKRCIKWGPDPTFMELEPI